MAWQNSHDLFPRSSDLNSKPTYIKRSDTER